jgi:hypothetical protein
MKKILFASIVGLSVLSFNIQAAEPAKKPEVKKACVKDTKTGKEVCKDIKVHKKLEGTKVPEKK